MIEVLITIPFSNEILTQFRNISSRIHITVQPTSKTDDVPPEIWAKTEVLYTGTAIPVPEQVPNLRWIQFHWAGIDHIASNRILQKPGLIITSLSGVVASKMAEFTVMMLLALGLRLPDLIGNQKRAEWPRDRWERFSPRELRGSTVGIVGYGSIGRQVARLLREFNATILATKQDVMHPEDSGYIPEGQGDPTGDFVHRLYPAQALRSMMKECDFVVITVPLSKDTHHLIGADELALLKQTAFIVNISRGEIIEPGALLEALRENKIAGAALDVFPEEPLPPDHPLWKLPNVILTPHIAGNTPHYNERAALLFTENLYHYLADMPLYNTFNIEKGY